MSEKLLRFLAEGKLWVTVLSQIFGFLLMWNLKITPAEYLTLSISVPVAFITGSILEGKVALATTKS